MNSNVIYRCLLSGLLAVEVGSGCIPSDELLLPGRLEPDDSLDEEVLGVGTWGDVTALGNNAKSGLMSDD